MSTQSMKFHDQWVFFYPTQPQSLQPLIYIFINLQIPSIHNLYRLLKAKFYQYSVYVLDLIAYCNSISPTRPILLFSKIAMISSIFIIRYMQLLGNFQIIRREFLSDCNLNIFLHISNYSMISGLFHIPFLYSPWPLIQTSYCDEFCFVCPMSFRLVNSSKFHFNIQGVSVYLHLNFSKLHSDKRIIAWQHPNKTLSVFLAFKGE